MTVSSHASGRALRLRTRSGGAVTFTSASSPARRLNASLTSLANVAGMKPLNPSPFLLIVS